MDFRINIKEETNKDDNIIEKIQVILNSNKRRTIKNFF